MNRVFLIHLLLFTGQCFAKDSFQFSHVSVTDGLPSTIIRKIIQDKEGYMWFATKNGLVKYNGYDVEVINDATGKNLGDIRSLVIDQDGSILIASQTQGLFRYKQGIVTKNNIFGNQQSPTVTAVSLDVNNDLWVGTTEGTYKVSNNNKALKLRGFKDDISYGFLNLDNQHILAQTKKTIYQYNLKTNNKRQIDILPADNYNNYVLHKDVNKNIWLGRANGLYLFDQSCHCFKSNLPDLENIKVYSLVSDQQFLWIGTTYNGLYRFDLDSSELINIKHDNQKSHGLSDDSIYSLFIDRSKVVWVGTFHSGVNFINPSNFEFDSITAENGLANCSKNFAIHDIIVNENLDTWLATENGLVKISKDNECIIFNHEKYNHNSLSADPIIALYEDKNDDLLIMNERGGLDKFFIDSGQIIRIGSEFNHISFYFAFETQQNQLILGSHKSGLYLFDTLDNKLSKITNLDQIYDKASFYSYAIDKSNHYYFATSHGIAGLNSDLNVEKIELNYPQIDSIEATVISFDANDNLWIAANNQYLLIKQANGKVIDITPKLINDTLPLEVTGIIPTDPNMMWLSSNRGIFKIDNQTYQNWHFTTNDGLQDAGFLSNSSYQDQDGKIYFGGKKGVNSFYPNKITINQQPPQVAITSFNYFNKKLKPRAETNSSFILNKDINYLDHIELGYKDYIIGFEFSALDYADNMRNKYAYRLLGLNDNWVNVDASDRKATYTNLSSGHYTFQLKASNKDGIWNQTAKEMKITVYPAPWLSKWAFMAYFMTVILSIWAFIRYKTIASRKRAQQLEATVTERTHEVNLQKKMVESLLDHKNEVFANVTHEFKTPLALILGPIELLANEPELRKHQDALNMVQRNAKRLFLMVGQILKLSQAEVNKEIIRESQAVHATLTMLYESFKPLAQDKNIKLTIENHHRVNVYTTSECLEIVIGNLLSNALKFTASNGEIKLSSKLVNKQISIHVKDTGSGISKKDLDKIFQRFVRLNAHKSIQGTGIGLAVVKEITQANNGEVTVNSELGQGSEFVVTFPITEIDASEELSQAMVDQMVDNTENELSATNNTIESKPDLSKKHVTVLIIEDNLDMQTHIDNVLKKRFNCLFADRGTKGIALALQEVPDIVICDVMMPGMDGYQVTRILRHDGRTSHIPIVLLTALNTKESRIKGWRENIDVYVTKPFDATELNAQLDNILAIRKILQKNTNKAIKTNKSLDSLDLPKQDQIFIEKFKDIIANHYHNEYFQKADLASKMAISERQLQRKIKALIDENPMDIMRDYRLEKAAMKLKDGYQVSIVSDQCGFGSVSYFGKCFKQKYGVTPKKYQQMGQT